MVEDLDPRIVKPEEVAFLQACHRRVPFHLADGAALAGAHLKHRLSADADLFLHDREAPRDLVRALPEVAAETGARVQVVRDAASFVRATAHLGPSSIDRGLHAVTARLFGSELAGVEDVQFHQSSER